MKNSTIVQIGVTIGMLWFIFPIAAAIITPPDVIAQVVAIIEMAIVYGLLTLIISRLKSLEQTPESIKILIIILVCTLSITIPCSITLLRLILTN